jgi:hypothetical protein
VEEPKLNESCKEGRWHKQEEDREREERESIEHAWRIHFEKDEAKVVSRRMLDVGSHEDDRYEGHEAAEREVFVGSRSERMEEARQVEGVP